MVTTEAATGRVLVIEDDAEIADVLRRFLRQEGHDVRTAADGDQAIPAAAEFVPDLVILDLGLPGIDGVEVCRRLRADARFRATPIVMLTAATQPEDVRRGIEAGASEYLTKPFSPVRLLTLVDALTPEATPWPLR